MRKQRVDGRTVVESVDERRRRETMVDRRRDEKRTLKRKYRVRGKNVKSTDQGSQINRDWIDWDG